ncbi:MAG: hypothetical protein AMJ45_04400 [Syntrophobacter sp. DG_60]|nr:MAG: hypothetical protein AMJ45_04400 [Syntrophobacter sp. DG_60]
MHIVYSIIKTNDQKSFSPIGINGEKVYTIVHQDIAAVVSNSSPLSFTSKELILRNLASYHVVIEQIMKSYTTVPMKFGTMVKDEGEVKKILKGAYPQIKDVLKAMEGKIELDVAVLWSDMDSTLKEVGQEEKIKRFKEEIEKKKLSKEEFQQEKIKLGKMVKALLDKKKDKCGAEIVNVLKSESEAFCHHDLMDESMIMNTAFLIYKAREEAFTSKVSQLDKRYEGELNFRIVGPLPPYSFSTLEVRRAKFEEIDQAKKILELGEEASISEIKEAYRRLTRRFHPDKSTDPEAQKRFEEINKAHKVLIDYCQSEKSSFMEADVKDFIGLKLFETSRIFK